MKRKFINVKSLLATAILVSCSVLIGCQKETIDEPEVKTDASVSHLKTTGGSCPSSLTCPTGHYNNGGQLTQQCGCYVQAGLGTYKQAFYNANAGDDFLAAAMMETNTMNPYSYVYGDKYPNDVYSWYYTDNGGKPSNMNGPKVWKAGAPKQFDASNFGACKQNWFMMRQSYSRYSGKTALDWNSGWELNANKNIDIASYKAGRAKWSESQFLAGHRNGPTGLSEALQGRYTYDIQNFIAAYQWTRSQIQKSSSYRINDVRFWVSVPNI